MHSVDNDTIITLSRGQSEPQAQILHAHARMAYLFQGVKKIFGTEPENLRKVLAFQLLYKQNVVFPTLSGAGVCSLRSLFHHPPRPLPNACARAASEDSGRAGEGKQFVSGRQEN